MKHQNPFIPMKRTILLLLSVALSSIAFGQEIPDYLAEGKFWSIYCKLVTPDEPTLNLGIAFSWIDYSGSRSELLCCKKDNTFWYQNALYKTCAINTDYEEENYLEEGKEWTIQASTGSGLDWFGVIPSL